MTCFSWWNMLFLLQCKMLLLFFPQTVRKQESSHSMSVIVNHRLQTFGLVLPRNPNTLAIAIKPQRIAQQYQQLLWRSIENPLHALVQASRPYSVIQDTVRPARLKVKWSLWELWGVCGSCGLHVYDVWSLWASALSIICN